MTTNGAEGRAISTCEVCGNDRLTPVLDLGLHPLCDDLVPVGSDRQCTQYPIDVLFCERCRTAHQRFQPPKRELFPPTYHYRARFTKDVLDGMRGLVDAFEQQFGSVRGKTVLDIGCNDGSLLGFFRERGATTLGIEPTGAAAEAQAQGHQVWNDFLSVPVAEQVVAAHGKPDVITFTNVFAHIEDLSQVLASLRALMGPKTVLVIENHYLGSVLDSNQFDTFYHEHPRTYSYTSFVHIAKSLGVELIGVSFPSRYGGNIRVFLGAGAPAPAPSIEEGNFVERFAVMSGKVRAWQRHKRAVIEQAVAEHGPLLAKAFPARAAILCRLLGLDERLVAATHEKPGSPKVGHYIPGTRIPIRSDDDLFAEAKGASPILNLAWHIPNEIRSYLAQHGCQSPVIDIVSPADFAEGGGGGR